MAPSSSLHKEIEDFVPRACQRKRPSVAAAQARWSGHDPPGAFTRFLHPRSGRHGDLPPDVIPLGRSIVVPANGSLPNIVLSPRSIGRVRDVLRTEPFDLLHLHEPLTPAICRIAECGATTRDSTTFPSI